ncbi:MAG: hypothetical protein GKR85_09740 [Candidatus Nanopelagicales bacterium]|nr:hypothetical protein [Candidatus Nanopelagicales bacterium]
MAKTIEGEVGMKIRSIMMATVAAGALFATATPAMASSDYRNTNGSHEYAGHDNCESLTPMVEQAYTASTGDEGLPTDEWLVGMGGIGQDYAICKDRTEGVDWPYELTTHNELNRTDRAANADYRNENARIQMDGECDDYRYIEQKWFAENPGTYDLPSNEWLLTQGSDAYFYSQCTGPGQDMEYKDWGLDPVGTSNSQDRGANSDGRNPNAA